jgi:hypothetical protein
MIPVVTVGVVVCTTTLVPVAKLAKCLPKLSDGDSLGLGDTLLDGDTDELALGEAEGLGLGLIEALGLIDAEGLFEAEGEVLGLIEGLAEIDGLGLSDRLGKKLGDSESDSLRLALSEGDSEPVADKEELKIQGLAGGPPKITYA